ncbi:hypothetical protein [Amycolatopsis panacis]|uniref:PE domain-containing protein n=1 Tax=Amycolatopsis panacis TaxID=2340917 RepID=A0A419I7E4_9PSEU|nr:hypothetical protein [Amycolatopsis panacis]RJQ87634.1 hypothetical protein D5S19_08755 [Amycolatopsis panacis]
MADTKHGGTYGTDWVTSFGQAVTGGGYSFDKQTLKHIAKEFEELAVEFDRDVEYAQVIARTRPPGQDIASRDNAGVFRNSGDALVKSLKARADYCRNQSDKFRTALGKYATAEDTHATEVKNTGGSL